MTELNRARSVAVVAGETSGDFHGAHLVRAMREADPALCFWGIGGSRLRSEGMEILVDAQELSVVGITEAFAKVPKVLSAFGLLKERFAAAPPDLLVLIDFPDFNLRVAKLAKRRDIPVLYYISPQLWAWRSGRINTIRRYVDRMAVILPFEKSFYESRNVAADFVGHPLLDYYGETDAPAEEPAAGLTIGILPGSRRGEIEKNLPVMLAAAARIREALPEARFLVSVAPGMDAEWMERWLRPYTPELRVDRAAGEVREVFEKSVLILAASGTVTLETAIFGVPMIIIYRISPLSYVLGKALVNVEHIGLVNLIAGERVVPEFIQEAANPSAVAGEAIALIKDEKRRGQTRKKLRSVRRLLGSPGAAERTAAIAFEILHQKS
jgi:lipid-A-disaccharide synthase